MEYKTVMKLPEFRIMRIETRKLLLIQKFDNRGIHSLFYTSLASIYLLVQFLSSPREQHDRKTGATSTQHSAGCIRNY